MKRLTVLLVLSLAGGGLSGCVFLLGAGAGVGSYSFVKGNLTKTYPVKINKAYHASIRALKSLEMKVTEKNKDAFAGKITALRGNGTKVVIRIKTEDTGVTRISVRVGLVGNKSVSEKIQARIAKYLKR